MTAQSITNPCQVLTDAQESMFQTLLTRAGLTEVNNVLKEVPDKATASVTGYSGQKIPWLVRINMTTTFGLQTYRITAIPPVDSKHPGFTAEYGLVPPNQFFFYVDYLPRVDLITEPEYLYSEPYVWLEERLQSIRKLEGMTPFVSSSPFIRAIMSPCAIVFTCPPTETNGTTIVELGNQALQQWLQSLYQSPVAILQAISNRDHQMLLNGAIKDPGAAIAAQLFGQEPFQELQQAIVPKMK